MTPRDPSDFTNRVLLEHMQAMKEEFLLRLSAMGSGLGNRLDTLDKRMEKMETKMEKMETKMEQGFQEAREHREALQEDLEATILQVDRVQKDHGRRITRLERHTGLLSVAR
jgi:septation ring formation regulator EzrA